MPDLWGKDAGGEGLTNRMIRDLTCILLILIIPMRLMELLEIDTFLLNIIAESEVKANGNEK